ncbi:hypothetical protein [Leptospira vanthielii]|uniref:hypothetical protein n=1 Tax=Leptospira vanthielii TaxID=293085 RepID=UPI001AEF517C|nr:hypothetical protein [Leptospira vanthielii]
MSTQVENDFESVSEYYQANAGVLGPLLNQLVAVDPITAAFPTADFDGDGAPNFEDPMVPSLGPVITVSSISAASISATNGSINSTDFTWRSSKTGTYSIRKNAADCNTGTIIYSGNVTANVNITSEIPVSSLGSEGSKSIFVCVSNLVGTKGGTSVAMIVDFTIPKAQPIRATVVFKAFLMEQ